MLRFEMLFGFWIWFSGFLYFYENFGFLRKNVELAESGIWNLESRTEAVSVMLMSVSHTNGKKMIK